MAEQCGQRVEILDQRTENAQTFAKPGGGFTTESSMEPRWARKTDGTWTDVDTTLELVNGAVTPVASSQPVVFSAGGAGPAARLRDGDRELSITWPFGSLPKPTLSGPDATYAEVLPGVDLKLTASALGFSEVLIVKTREAAKNPKLAKVKFGFATKNVTASATGAGGLEAKDARGKVVFSSPTPLMWDSTPAQSSAAMSSANAESRPVTMPVAVENGELTVTPDAAMMTDAATRFPVYIDPSWTRHLKDNAWTLVTNKSGKASTSFWQGGGFLQEPVKGTAGTGLTCDSYSSSGSCLSATYNVRSYFRMDLSGLAGKQIVGASFRIKQLWAWGCNPRSDATVRVTYDIDGGTTWNNQPGWWNDSFASSAPANRKLGAEHSCDGPGDAEFNVKDIIGYATGRNWGAITFVLHVGNEGVVNQWKRFDPSTPLLAIDHNTPPSTPDQLTVDAKPCDSRAYVPTVRPIIAARVRDVDNDTIKARFEWARIREDGSRAEVGEVTELGGFGNDTTATFTIPSLPTGLKTGVLDRSDAIVGTGDWDNNGHTDVLSRDGGGYLYLFPGYLAADGGHKLGNRVLLGSGWNGVTIAGVGDWDSDGKPDIVARIDSDGELFLYPGEGKAAPSTQPRVRIGGGFHGFQFGGLADYDKDTKQDLIGKDGNGELLLYPGESKRAPSTQPRILLGSGWNLYTLAGVIDRTGDGAPDVIAEQGGTLWLYLGSGKRAPYAGTPYRHDIGKGWGGTPAMTIRDFTGDGAPDIIANWSGTWHVYPGVVGTGYGGDSKPVAAVGLTDGGVYSYRVAAGDEDFWSSFTNWCDFEVDISAPAKPTVSASVYKPTGCPDTGCGSVGVADTFTFASTSSDVVKYRWGFTDPPAMTVPVDSPTVRWTPPTGGPKTLYVEAIDRAGLRSERTLYQFRVAKPTVHTGRWLDGADPAKDTSGMGHDLTLTGVQTGQAGRLVGGDPAVGFDGSTAAAATTTKILDTGKSFTVSAWVRLTNDTVNRTAVSQQGSVTSAFRLGYDAAQRRWAFSIAESNTTSSVQRSAVSDVAVTPGVWTHLTGTYETSNREVRLYVDGALQQTIGLVANGFNAAGELWVGSRRHNGARVDPWFGQLADVRVWGRTITPAEVADVVNPITISGVGTWKFDEGQGSTAYDSSPFLHDLTLALGPGASWGQGVCETTGGSGCATGLHLNGTGSADSNEAVLNTDQSFTVDVWARLAETGANRTVVTQRSSFGDADPFTLRYDGAKWMVEMPNGSMNPTTWWRVKSQNDAAVNDWTRLKVTYDAAARTLQLWVDDVLQGTATGVRGWNSDGVLSVGRGSGGVYWFGDIDELKVYQGAVAAKPLDTKSPIGSSLSGDAGAEIISVDADGGVRAFVNVNGTYSGSIQQIGSGWTPERTRFADLDADGRTEIIALDPDGAIKAFHNVNGMNGFPFGAMHVVGRQSSTDPSRTQFADVDGDGRADRVSLDPDNRVRVYRNLFGLNALGQSTAFATAPVIVKVLSVSHDRIRFADIDGDRKDDLITINEDRTVSSYRNSEGLGYGTFDSYQDIGADWTSDRTWFANIEGDGRDEIITVKPDGSVWSYPNIQALPSPPFGAPRQIGSGWSEPARVLFS